MRRKPVIVISAVNFREGGPLTVLRECAFALRQAVGDSWTIVALVNDGARVGVAGIEYRQYRWPAKSWIARLFYEYCYFDFLSRQLKPDIWISLHDVSPFVSSRIQAVYCHNPAPFHKLTFREAWLDWKFAVFSFVYKVFYSVNIESNQLVVVQQEWLRREFMDLCRRPRIVVAHPDFHASPLSNETPKGPKKVLFYPALPRVFKNFEILGQACRILESRGVTGFEVRLTIHGDENAYSRDIYRQFGALSSLKFIGRLTRDEMMSQYSECDLVLFLSKLETWGLPITEAKAFGCGIVAADLPYAHETVGSYDRVVFCNPSDAHALARILESEINGNSKLSAAKRSDPDAPYVRGWAELMRFIIGFCERAAPVADSGENIF